MSSWALFTSRWGKAVLIALALNFGWFAIQGSSETKSLSLQAADKELRETYGNEHKVMKAVDELAPENVRTKKELRPALDALNALLADDGDEYEEIFSEENFYFFGDTIVYTESRREKNS